MKLKHYRAAAFRAAWRRAMAEYRKLREEWWTVDDAPPFDEWLALQGASAGRWRASEAEMVSEVEPPENVDPAQSCAVYGQAQNLEKPKARHDYQFTTRAYAFDDPRRADMLALIGSGRVVHDVQARCRIVDTRLLVDGREVIVSTSVWRMWQRRRWLEPDADSPADGADFVAWRVVASADG